jgi:hypothetical protein
MNREGGVGMAVDTLRTLGSPFSSITPYHEVRHCIGTKKFGLLGFPDI